MASLASSTLLPRQAAFRPHVPTQVPSSLRFRRVISRAKPEGTPPAAPPQSKEPKSKEDGVIEELQRSGMTAKKAKEILRQWEEMGVTDPDQLRKLLVNRSLQPLQGLGIQAVLDMVAAGGALYLGNLAQDSPGLPGGVFLQVLGYFFFFYYSIQVFAQLSVGSALLYSAYRFGTSSPELLAAVQQLAQTSGLSVVDKVQVAVNTIKVMQQLENMSKILQETYGGDATKPYDALRNLSAYLTLANAKEKLGFDPATYGLTEKQAGNIAYAFSIYDKNDNGKLELGELSTLCKDLDEGCPLDDNELKEAYKTLDTNKSGYIEFNEFVDWWVKKQQA